VKSGVAYFYPRYVPVRVRQRNAEKELARMRREGVTVQPVSIEGRGIARTFWGKAWCKHLESFSDFANRLPRGRTYVRNGSVCHLAVERGRIRARVQGSQMYDVSINVAPLSGPAWKSIKEQCTGKISSLLDLLQGRLSAGVMEIVTDREKGLFPKPREIHMDCSCPDRAVMCKHVAAALYGVGARLDEKPELLFLLRAVDHDELITSHAEAAVRAAVGRGKGRRIAEEDVAGIFGVEIEEQVPATGRTMAPAHGKARARVRARSPREADPSREAGPPSPARPLAGSSSFPEAPTGSDVTRARERLRLSRGEFAELLGVSEATISKWERSTFLPHLQRRTREALQKAWKGRARRLTE
jgi:uncharacterized Zn finger protein